METKKTITRNQVLNELDIRTLPDGRKRIFSIKFVTAEGKLVFLPQAYACGAGRMNNKRYRVRGIQPCDCKGNPEMHVYPVSIDAIVQYEGMKHLPMQGERLRRERERIRCMIFSRFCLYRNIEYPLKPNDMKAIYFSDLALQYFPESTKRSATRQLKRWIMISTDLHDRLQELHYQPRQRALTPLQHEAVVRFLGEP